MPKYFAGVAFVGSCFLFAYIPLSFAALGGAPMESPPGAIVTSRVKLIPALERSANASSASNYSLVETRTSTGDISREYVSGGNRVFAVAWEGRHIPNMATLLGWHFNQYRMAAMINRTASNSHTPPGVILDDLIVYVSGRTGNFYIRAWLPDALPAGFRSDAVR
ncbi:DUF2844 domain-containing protein [Burkholderia sp. JSH-S8]|nr:DUF2844 domain-containing protein [Burkholderia sp. JSH-S8]